MKQLEAEKIVEKCWDEDIQRDFENIGYPDFENIGYPICKYCRQRHHLCEPCDYKDPSYKDFWLNKAHNMSICRRDDMYFQGNEN